MSNTYNEWLEDAISAKKIKYFDRDEFNEFVQIGEGGNSYIYKSEWKDFRLTVALKSLKVSMNSDENDVKKLVKELQFLQRVGFHPNINRFYGVIKDSQNGPYNLVLEYANNGDLRSYLRINFSKLEWTDKIRMAKEITRGLLFLHSNNIIHHDLHSKNVLVHEGSMMITDFGFSKHMDETSTTSNSIDVGMPAYIEPQYIKNPSYIYDKRSDIYSLGVIFWELSSGQPPFHSFTTNEAIAIHIYKGMRENPVEGTPSQYIELFKQCWDENPEKRPVTKTILNDLNQLSSNDSYDISEDLDDND